jgi:hypothetical protein
MPEASSGALSSNDVTVSSKMPEASSGALGRNESETKKWRGWSDG